MRRKESMSIMDNGRPISYSLSPPPSLAELAVKVLEMGWTQAARATTGRIAGRAAAMMVREAAKDARMVRAAILIVYAMSKSGRCGMIASDRLASGKCNTVADH